mgnify:CR=1 FL=1
MSMTGIKSDCVCLEENEQFLCQIDGANALTITNDKVSLIGSNYTLDSLQCMFIEFVKSKSVAFSDKSVMVGPKTENNFLYIVYILLCMFLFPNVLMFYKNFINYQKLSKTMQIMNAGDDAEGDDLT